MQQRRLAFVRGLSIDEVCVSRVVVIVLLSAVSGCSGSPESSSPPATVSSDVSTAKLIEDLDSEDGRIRVSATAELFRRGTSAFDALTESGAHPMETIRPARRDVIMTLVVGLDQTIRAPFRRDSFGLHVETGVSAEEIIEMGRRHGFLVPVDWVLQPEAYPTVYVQLSTNTRLEDVLEAVLSTEPRVRTVNLNYIEPG